MATFVGTTATEAMQAVCDTVDDYLAMCLERGIEPEEPAGVRVIYPTASHAARASCRPGDW